MSDPLVDSADSRGVLRLVEEYCSTQRPLSLPKFTIHSHTHKSWRHTPCSAKAGCYALYAEDGSLIYIGKASHGAWIGRRLSIHFDPIRDGVPEGHRWSGRAPRFVHIIEVVEPFEAPSLEEYLQSRWQNYKLL